MAENSIGILIFPSVIKAGLGVAGEYGDGVLHIRSSNAGYFKIVSASIGLTAGIVNRSQVIMFMTQDALDRFLMNEDWNVGVDASIALVYQGASGQHNINTTKEPILGFIFSETGLMGDLSWKAPRSAESRNNAPHQPPQRPAAGGRHSSWSPAAVPGSVRQQLRGTLVLFLERIVQ
jgi:lipid-binding SYLF domain-containing protein